MSLPADKVEAVLMEVYTTAKAVRFGVVGPLQRSTVHNYMVKIVEYEKSRGEAGVNLDHCQDLQAINNYLFDQEREDDYITHFWTALKRLLWAYGYENTPAFQEIKRLASDHYKEIVDRRDSQEPEFTDRETKSIDELTEGGFGAIIQRHRNKRDAARTMKRRLVCQQAVVICLMIQELKLRPNEIRLLETKDTGANNYLNLSTGAVNIRVQKQNQVCV